ncbi:LEA type 2 family protein [Acidobacteriota bacterium]
MKRLAFYAIFLLVLSNIAMSFSLEDDIQISLREKQIQELSPSGLNLVFYITIKNLSSKTYYLSGYTYQFTVNQQEYLQMQTNLEDKIRVDARGETLIALPVKITYELLFQAVPGVENETRVQCYMTGMLSFADEKKERGRLPFSFSGEFPVFKEPQVQLVGLTINALTIGGSDLSFELKIENDNDFELLPERIRYKVAIGGFPIGEDRIRGDKSVESKGEKVFSLPFLLNFFEVGKDVHAFLQQDEVSCQLSGEIEIKTVWGRLVIPFDRDQHVSVKKTF